MIDVTEEGGPVQARRLRLLPDGFPPVEGLEDALVLDHERAVGELRGQADHESAEHVAAAWGVLVGREVAVTRVNVEVVQLRGEGGRVLRYSASPAAAGAAPVRRPSPHAALGAGCCPGSRG